MEITLASYAKINLTLEVSARRPDGFHDIDSIVQIIDLADELVVSEGNDGSIDVIVDSGNAPSGRENLVFSACEAFLSATSIRSGTRCVLKKRTPMQAGLGGGSSNAAAAIRALNRLYECGLPDSELARIAAQVGSDAPLFVHGGTVRMRGRGEQVEPLPYAPEMHLVVVKPEIGVSTVWAYAELDKRAQSGIRGVSDLVEQAIRHGDHARVVAGLGNDFDPVVVSLCEPVRQAKQRLRELGAEAALLSGSGSAVFGVFASLDDSQAAADALDKEFPEVFRTRSIGRAESLLMSVDI